MKKEFNWVLYYFVFCPLHYMVYELQPARSEEEREVFMEKFHYYDVID